MMRKSRKIDVLTGKLIVTISIVIGICMCSLLVSQSWAVRQMKNNIIAQNMTVLELTQTIVDSHLDHTRKLSQLLLLNKDISRFIYQGPVNEGSPAIQTIIDAQTQLPVPRSVNPILEEIIVYSQASGYLLTTRNAIFDIDKMYALIEFEDMNSRQWQSKYLWSGKTVTYHPSVMASVNGQKKKVLPYIQSFPLSNPSENAGKLIFLINESYFENMLRRLDLGENGRYCITDPSHTIIMSNGPIPWNHEALENGQHDLVGTDGVRYLVSVVSSTDSHLTFFSAIPYRELHSRHNPVWGLFSFTTTTALFICFLIIILTAYRSQKNWSRLKHLLSSGDTFSNSASYEQITTTIKSITELQTENELLVGRPPFMLEALFRRIIHGKPVNAEDVRMLLSRSVHVFPLAPDMSVALAKIIWHDADEATRIDDIDFSRIAAAKEAEQIFGKQAYLYMDTTFTVWLMIWDAEPDRIERNVQKFWTSFKKVTPYEISMALSSTSHTLENIQGISDECTITACSILNENRKTILRKYAELQGRTDTYSYTKDLEQALVSAYVKRDATIIQDIMQDIYDTNFKNRRLAPDQSLNLFKALHESAVLASQKDSSPVLPSPFTLFSEVYDFFLDHNGTVPNSKLEREKQMATTITAYIHEHFSNPHLTLSDVAQTFKMRENFLYHFMSTRMGTSFSHYLEDYRLSQAKTMLLERNNDSITDIALACGYANPQTFRRAFKKHFGILPSDFRTPSLPSPIS